MEPPVILRNMTPYVFYRSILVRTNWSMNLKKDYIYFSKRENLHLHLVLVAVPGIPLESGHCLQNRDSLQPVHQSIRAQAQIQVRNQFKSNLVALERFFLLGTKNIVWRNPDVKTNIYFTVLIRLLELSEFRNKLYINIF